MEGNMSEIIEDKRLITIKPDKDIIKPMAEEFRDELLKVAQDNNKNFKIDLTDVKEVDQVGISILVAFHNLLKDNGNELSIVNVSDNVHKLFKRLRLDVKFNIV